MTIAKRRVYGSACSGMDVNPNLANEPSRWLYTSGIGEIIVYKLSEVRKLCIVLWGVQC